MGNAQAGGALFTAILWSDNGMLFPLFSRDYCGNQLLIYVALRNLFLNNLSLANDSIRFHSLCHCTVCCGGYWWCL